MAPFPRMVRVFQACPRTDVRHHSIGPRNETNERAGLESNFRTESSPASETSAVAGTGRNVMLYCGVGRGTEGRIGRVRCALMGI